MSREFVMPSPRAKDATSDFSNNLSSTLRQSKVFTPNLEHFPKQVSIHETVKTHSEIYDLLDSNKPTIKSGSILELRYNKKRGQYQLIVALKPKTELKANSVSTPYRDVKNVARKDVAIAAILASSCDAKRQSNNSDLLFYTGEISPIYDKGNHIQVLMYLNGIAEDVNLYLSNQQRQILESYIPDRLGEVYGV